MYGGIENEKFERNKDRKEYFDCSCIGWQTILRSQRAPHITNSSDRKTNSMFYKFFVFVNSVNLKDYYKHKKEIIHRTIKYICGRWISRKFITINTLIFLAEQYSY